MRTAIFSMITMLVFALAAPLARGENPPAGQKATAGLILTAAEKRWLADHRTVRVRISDAYPPFEFFADNRYQGMACDYLALIGSRLGIDFLPVPGLSWPEALARLQEKRGVDLALAITPSAERSKSIAFTRDYLAFPHVIITNKYGHFVAGLKDLDTAVVAVEKGFIMKEWLQRDLPGSRIVEYDSSAAALQAVSTGSADATVQNLAVGTYLIDKLGLVNLKIAAQPPYGDDNLAMGVRNDWPELARLVDKALSSLTEEEHRTIRQRWLAVRFEHVTRQDDIVKWTVAVAALALSWILLLRRAVRRRTAALQQEIERRRAVEEDLRQRNDDLATMENELRQNLDRIQAAQEEISRSHLLLQSFMDNTFGFQGLLTPEGILLDANRTALDFIGCDKQEVVGRHFWETPWWRHDISCQQEVRAAVRRAAAGELVRFETTHLAGDESLHTVDISLKSIRDEGGAVTYLIAEGRDITDRKQAENALAQEKLFIDTVIDSLPVIFYVRTEEGYVRWNRLLEEFSGHTPQELRTLSATADICDEDMGQQQQMTMQCQSDGSTRGKLRVRSPHGIRTLYITGKEMVLGGVAYTVGAAIDLTEQEEVQQALQASEARLQLYFRRLPVGAIVWDRHYRVQQWNPAAERIFGYAAEEAVGKTANELIVPDYIVADLDNIWKKLIDGDMDAHSINENRTRDNRTIICSWTNTPLHDNRGGVIGVISVVEDISARVNMEIYLRESEERFREIFTQNDDAILLIDLKTLQVVDANPAALDLYGISREKLDQLNPAAFIDRNDLRKFMNPLPLGGVTIKKATSFRPDGKKIVISVKAKIIQMRNERVILCAIRDITEKIRLEEEIRATQAKMIQANKMTSLGMLVSGVGHEINNPNQCIATNAAILARIWQDAAHHLRGIRENEREPALGGLPFDMVVEKAPRLFAGISESSRKINAIVSNMRDFVRQEKASHEGVIEINRVIDSATTILWHHIHKHTDAFSLQLQEPIPPARGSSQQIEQVIINLLTNALQALPDKSRGVTVETAADPEQGDIVISVRDEGVGMSATVLARLTEPFYTTRSDAGGTGLGLYISANIIREHHGTLSFSSEPGKGTLATIRLPMATRRGTD